MNITEDFLKFREYMWPTFSGNGFDFRKEKIV